MTMNQIQMLDRFTDQLVHQMQIQKMTQSELAQKSGMEQGTVSNLLSSKRRPSLWSAYRLADSLGLTLNDMIKPIKK